MKKWPRCWHGLTNGSNFTCNAAVSKKEAQTLSPFDRSDSFQFTKMQNNKAFFSFLFMHIKMLFPRACSSERVKWSRSDIMFCMFIDCIKSWKRIFSTIMFLLPSIFYTGGGRYCLPLAAIFLLPFSSLYFYRVFFSSFCLLTFLRRDRSYLGPLRWGHSHSPGGDTHTEHTHCLESSSH